MKLVVNSSKILAQNAPARKFAGSGLLKGKHVVSATMFDRAGVDHMLQVAKRMSDGVKKDGVVPLCKHKLLGNLFFEPSTRTASSFATAMMRLGGNVIPVNPATSSAAKGETLEDTIRVMNNYIDVIAIRHPEVGSAARAASVSRAPILNAGDGAGEHPTQALLDLFCMKEELGHLDNITITLVGDLKYGRTVHSMSALLNHYKVKLNLIAPEALKMPDDVVKSLKKPTVYQSEKLSKEVLRETDVLYVTRIQKERFTDLAQYNALKGVYIITPDTLKECKKKMVVMHPLPRVDEIVPGVDSDSRGIYFKQPEYGMFMRMALLASVLGAV